ncbi:MAG: mannosyl-3-phosphoglycerate phosphatase-related protein [Desulfuromonas sp.]|nr:MAG: mannosyl-3-phosphoglycerate phosphatase-related protein [Desulfuromonas sp.]
MQFSFGMLTKPTTDPRRLIVFTDLDGTLLDHDSYSWAPATPALAKLRRLAVPVILTSSKTGAEIARLHAELELDAPYIVENGAGIIFPEQEQSPAAAAQNFSRTYPELLAFLHQLRHKHNFKFRGFGDFSVAEVAAETGLPLEKAALARERRFSEPLRWDDTPAALAAFTEILEANDLKLLRGGRFYHVLDHRAGKGNALHRLLDHYRRNTPGADWYSVALGDGPNDEDMLDAADLAVVIPSASSIGPKPHNPNVLHAGQRGPQGWNSAILQILDSYETKE